MSSQQSTGQEEVARFLAAHQDLTSFVRRCGDEEWAMVVPVEERTVAVMADHMAAGYDLVTEWVELAQAGKPIPGTRAEQDMENADHARARAAVSREEVLARLEAAAPRVAAVLAAVPQEVADGDVHFGPAEGPMPVGRLMSLAATLSHGAGTRGLPSELRQRPGPGRFGLVQADQHPHPGCAKPGTR